MKKVILFIKENGVFPLINCAFHRLHYEYLYLRFRFDHWHAKSPKSCRPYKGEIISLIDSYYPSTVVEVGCGLGDIIATVNAEKKVGIDIDTNVIAAARRLNNRTEFIAGSISNVSDCNFNVLDMLVMVNWLHALEPAWVQKEIESIVASNDIRKIFVDRIISLGDGYRYSHDFDAILSTEYKLKFVKKVDDYREVLVYEKRRSRGNREG